MTFKSTLAAMAITIGSLVIPMTHTNAAELNIETIEQGTGTVAENGMQVRVHYTGKLTDGTVFDSSIERGEPIAFVLGQGRVIQGWEQGILGMKVGEKRILTVPPELGYGAQGAGAVIPPNATLVFDVELVAASIPPKLTGISAEQLIVAQKNGALIIDIRLQEEWEETGIIEGAQTITAFSETGGLHPEFQTKFFDLVKGPETDIVLYCRTGNRTTMLGQALVDQLGFSNVKHLEHGIVDWENGGRETVPFTQ